jgi:hypothetical protein
METGHREPHVRCRHRHVLRRRGGGQGALRRYAALIGCNDDYYHGPPCGENVSGIAGLSVAANQTYDVVTSPAGALVEGEPALHDGYEDVEFSLELQRGETMKTTIIVTTCALIFAIPLGASEFGIQPPPKLPSVVAPSVPDPSRQGGDTIATALSIPALPYLDTGTTTGYADDYDEVCPTDGMGPDVVYAYTAPADQLIDIDLCGSDYDSKVFVYDDTFHLIACNDDYYFDAPCGIYTSKIEGAPLVGGGTYDIVVDGYGSDHGAYDLAVTVREHCEPACPSAGVAEGEPSLHEDYVDSFNGGCDFSHLTPALRVISGGANGEFVLCGTSGWYIRLNEERRDTDWFILFMGQTGTIEATFEAEESSFVAEVARDHCDGGLVQAATVGCEPATMTISGQAPEAMAWLRITPTREHQPIWADGEYDYVIWFTGLAANVATEATTWSTVKALYD